MSIYWFTLYDGKLRTFLFLFLFHPEYSDSRNLTADFLPHYFWPNSELSLFSSSPSFSPLSFSPSLSLTLSLPLAHTLSSSPSHSLSPLFRSHSLSLSASLLYTPWTRENSGEFVNKECSLRFAFKGGFFWFWKLLFKKPIIYCLWR